MPQAILPFGRFEPDPQPVWWDPPPLDDKRKLLHIIEANAVCGRIIIEQRVPRDLWAKWYPPHDTHVTVAIIVPATVKAVRKADKYCWVTRIVPNPQRADFERACDPDRVDLSMAAVCCSQLINSDRIRALNPWAFGRE